MKKYSKLEVFLLCIAYSIAMFHRSAFSELSIPIKNELHLDHSSIAMVGSVFFWVYLAVQIPAGILIDAAGARAVGWVGCALMGIGSLLFASGTTDIDLALGRGISAAGAVSVFLAMITYCSKECAEHASSEIGKGFFIGNLGGILAGVPLAIAIALSGWRETWGAVGFISAAIGVAILWKVEGEFDPAAFKLGLKRVVPSFVESLTHTEVYLAAGALAGLAGGFYAFSAFGATLMAKAYGFNPLQEGLIVSLMIAGYAVGSWFWGHLGDNIDTRHKILFVVPIGCAVLWALLAVIGAQSVWVTATLLISTGVLCGGATCIYTALDELCADKPLGAIKAASNCGMALAAALIQVVEGQLPEQYAVYPCAATALLGAACALFLTRRWKTAADTRFGELSVL